MRSARDIGSIVTMAQLAAADTLARATLSSVSLCEAARLPLSELQKIEIIKAGLVEFDGFHAQVAGLLEVERLLQDLHTNGTGGGGND